ncbi:MAG: GAF domain-containing sensor histidine kinase [Bacteroidia bacterium]|nr:GAF domain-containing sensor histidine kinase [Bacteroidia bacterium]
MESEKKRLEKLSTYHILDTPAENDFDELVLLASNICNTPISLISLIDEDRQWFKAKIGLSVSETPREISFCHHAILHNEIFIVSDATKDERFNKNPLVVGEPDIRFYAGMPLLTHDGFNLGTLCVIDRVPRILTAQQLDNLRILSKQVIKQMELKMSLEKEIAFGNILEDKRIQLEVLNELKNKIFSIVAHDLRTPLRNISSILEMFDDTDADRSELLNILPKLNEKVSVASEMLDNLLNWSQNEFAELKTVLQKEDVSEIIAVKVKQLEKTALEKKITIDNNIKSNLMAYIEPEVLRIVIRNLLTNAIKFSKAGSKIILSSEETQNNARIIVSDFGCGISIQNLATLFDEKNHLSTYGTGNEKGIGIGLKLCQSLLSKNNAILEVSSKEGIGSKFTIVIKNLTEN